MDINLPSELLAIWESLLERLDETYDSFPNILVWQMLEILGDAETTKSQ